MSQARRRTRWSGAAHVQADGGLARTRGHPWTRRQHALPATAAPATRASVSTSERLLSEGEPSASSMATCGRRSARTLRAELNRLMKEARRPRPRQQRRSPGDGGGAAPLISTHHTNCNVSA